jgi:hypothetical protein
MGKGFDIPWVWRVKENTIGMWLDIPWVGGFDIPWAGVSSKMP